MVGDDDALGAEIGGADGVVGVQDTLDDQRPLPEPAIAFQLAPSLARRRSLGIDEVDDLVDV